VASSGGHLKVVRELLKHHKIDVNAKDDDGDTALIAASENCHWEVVGTLLMHHELDVNARNDNGNTALLVASDQGHVEVVRKLLTRNFEALNQVGMNVSDAIDGEGEKGSRIGSGLLAKQHLDAKTATEGDSSDLLNARNDEQVESMIHLKSFAHIKLDVNAKSEDGSTALILASCNGHLNVVAALLKNEEVDVNAADTEGVTALIGASGRGHFEIVSELLKLATATCDIENVEGSTDVSIASGSTNQAEVVDWDLLGSDHEDVRVGKLVGNKKRHAVRVHGSFKAARMSLSHRKLDVNAQQSDGATALIVASGNGHVTVVCELLKCKEVDVNAKTVAGETCSSLADRNGHAEVVSALRTHENSDECA
jgi:serine/threonine-protein phosphatase 6 regulatory ankyrin repeat subunit B